MSFFGIFGNDRRMAATEYAGREAASTEAKRKRSQRHRRNAAKADREGWAWADDQRARQDKGWGRKRR